MGQRRERYQSQTQSGELGFLPTRVTFTAEVNATMERLWRAPSGDVIENKERDVVGDTPERGFGNSQSRWRREISRDRGAAAPTNRANDGTVIRTRVDCHGCKNGERTSQEGKSGE